jgi:hypothetical protein
MGWTDGALMIAVTQDVSVQAICTRTVTNRKATNGEERRCTKHREIMWKLYLKGIMET